MMEKYIHHFFEKDTETGQWDKGTFRELEYDYTLC